MKRELRRIYAEALARLEVGAILRDRVRRDGKALVVDCERLDLSSFERVLALSIGKAALPMATAAAEILAGIDFTGLLVAPVAPLPPPPPRFTAFVGGHPYPDAGSQAAARAFLVACELAGADDLVLFLVSGGGSALLEEPISPALSLQDMHELSQTLVTCGADIVRINAVRKHLSAVKGGRLAAAAHPARQVTLYFSDVPPDRPSAVSSGPTMPDETTCEDCLAVIARHELHDRLPASIRELIDTDALQETPKPGDPVFARSTWHSMMDCHGAARILEQLVAERGWLHETDLSVDDRPLEDAADHLLGRLAALAASHPDRTVCVLTTGELSSPVTGDGRGGRNQSFVLACAQRFARLAGEPGPLQHRPLAVLSAGTDGIDGNSPATGAVADDDTLARGRAAGLDADDHFRRSDSHTYLARLQDTIVTGPTGNNLRDLRILVAEPPRSEEHS